MATKGKTIYTVDDQLLFGKYNGKTVAWVLRNDPRYFQWCLENVAWFDTDPATEAIMKEALSQDNDRRSDHGYTRKDGVEYSARSPVSRNGPRPDSPATRDRHSGVDRKSVRPVPNEPISGKKGNFDDDVPF